MLSGRLAGLGGRASGLSVLQRPKPLTQVRLATQRTAALIRRSLAPQGLVSLELRVRQILGKQGALTPRPAEQQTHGTHHDHGSANPAQH